MGDTLVLGDLVVNITADTTKFTAKIDKTEKRILAFAKSTGNALSSSASAMSSALSGVSTVVSKMASVALAPLNMVAAGIDKVQEAAAATEHALFTAGKYMSLSVTAPIVTAATASVIAFRNFDSEMTKSTAIMEDMSKKTRQELEDTALTMSTVSVNSAAELAQSYFYLTSAGFSTAQSLESLEHVQNFAVAGMFDLAKATDLLTDAQSALGMTVDNTAQNTKNLVHVSDVLVRANSLANATVEQFARSLTAKSGAALKIVNKDIEEGVSVLAAYADQGVKAELAGERLAIVLRDVQTASLGKRGFQSWKELGLEAWTAAGKMRPLVDIIEMFEKRMKGMSDMERKQLLQMAGFQDRSSISLQMLIGLSGRIREYEQELRKAGGTTEKVAKKQLASFSSQMKIMVNRITEVTIGIGRMLVPMILWAMKKIGLLIDWWNKLTKASKTDLLVMAAIAAAIGPVLLLISGIVGAVGTAIAVLTSMAVPIGAIVYALIGKEGFVDAWKKAKEMFQDFVEDTPRFLKNFEKYLKSAVKWLKDTWKDAGSSVEGVFAIVTGIVEKQIARIVNTVKTYITGSLKAIGEYVLFAVTVLVDSILNKLPEMASGLAEKIGAEFNKAMDAIDVNAVIQRLIDRVDPSTLEAVIDAQGFFENFKSNMEKVFDWADKNWNIFLNNLGEMWIVAIENIAYNIMSVIGRVLGTVVKESGKSALDYTLPGIIGSVLGAYSGGGWGAVKKEFENLYTGGRIDEAIENARDSLAKSLIDNPLSNILAGYKGTPYLGLPTAGSGGLDLVTQDLKDELSSLAEYISNLYGKGRVDFAEKQMNIILDLAYMTEQARKLFLSELGPKLDAIDTRFSDKLLEDSKQRISVQEKEIAALDKQLLAIDSQNAAIAAQEVATREFGGTVSVLTLAVDNLAAASSTLLTTLSAPPLNLSEVPYFQYQYPEPDPILSSAPFANIDPRQDGMFPPVNVEVINLTSPEEIVAAGLSTRSGKHQILNIVGRNVKSGGVLRRQIRAGA